MKKIVLLTLSLCLCLLLGLTLVACDETTTGAETATDTTVATDTVVTDGATAGETADETVGETAGETELPTEAVTEAATVGVDGISKEEWQEAIATDNFTNVTIFYTLEGQGGDKQEQVVKITPEKVYRKVTAVMGGETFEQAICFVGEEAAMQGKMFIDVFLALLAERENFVYDYEAGIYNAPEKISTTIVAGPNMTANESVENGKVKFAADGTLEHFICDLTEAVYYGETLEHESTYAANWTFADYGKTVITEEEAAAGRAPEEETVEITTSEEIVPEETEVMTKGDEAVTR